MQKSKKNKNIIIEPGYITLSEAAKSSPYSQEYLSLLARNGKIQSKKFGRNWYTSKESIDEYLNSQGIKIVLPKNFINSSYKGKIIKPFDLRNGGFEKKPEVFFASMPQEFFNQGEEAQKDFPEEISNSQQYFSQREEPIQKITDDYKNKINTEKTVEDKVLDRLLVALEKKVPQGGDDSGDNIYAANIGDFDKGKNSYFFSPRKTMALIVAAIVLLFVLVGGFSFGNLDKIQMAVYGFFKNASTLQGHYSGTHANQVLLLDNNGNISISGHIETQGQLRSWVEDGVAPIVVDSTTTVQNLSVEMLDGIEKGDINLAFVTKSGNITYEDVELQGDVEVGETLLVKGAAKLLDNLLVYGGLGTLSDIEGKGDLKISGSATVLDGINTNGSNLNLGSGTVNLTNADLIENLNAEMINGKKISDFNLDTVLSNGNTTTQDIYAGDINSKKLSASSTICIGNDCRSFWPTGGGGGIVYVNDSNWILSGSSMYPSNLSTYIGIGTTTPEYNLDVNGNFRVTGTSTFGTIIGSSWQGSPIGIAYGGTGTSTEGWTGNLYINNGVWGTTTAGASLSGGQANYLPVWASETTLGTSTIYQSGNNVGIGTTTPTSTLTVYGTSTFMGGNVGIGTAPSTYRMGETYQYQLGIERSGGGQIDLIHSVAQISSQVLGTLYFSGVDLESYGKRSGAKIDAIASGNWTNDPRIAPTDLRFFTEDADISGYSSTIPRMVITSNGLVGVGTTTPSEMLTIKATSTNAILGVYTSSSAPALFVASSSYVGIGTNSPLYPLQVNGRIAAKLTTGSNDAILSADTWGGNSVTQYLYGGGLQYQTGSFYSGGTHYGIQERSGSSWLDRFVIASGGFVGIGTTTPATTLQVYGTSTFMGGNVGIGTTTPAALLDVEGTARVNKLEVDTLSGGILFNQTSNAKAIRMNGRNMGITFNNSSAYISLTDQSDNEAVVVKSGAVGIFNTSPGEALDITGNIKISGTLTANGTGSTAIAGNVGIGTVSPSSTLDVYGSARLGSSTDSILTVRGTSIFNNNFYIDTSGNVATGTWQGTPISSTYGGTATNTSAWTGYAYINNGVWSTSSAGMLSGGQENYIPYWTSDNALGTSTIYQSGDYIGIGTTTPSEMITIGATSTNAIFGAYTSSSAPALYVASSGNVSIGTTTSGGKLNIFSSDTTGPTVKIVGGTNTSQTTLMTFYRGDGGANLLSIASKNGNVPRIFSANSNRIEFGSGDNSHLVINTGGDVGIGTTTPASKLTVYGTTTFMGGNVGIGTVSPAAKFDLKDSSWSGGGTSTIWQLQDSSGVVRASVNKYGQFVSRGLGANGAFNAYDADGNARMLMNTLSSSMYIDLYNSSNQSSVYLYAGGSSYFNGGNLGIGTTTPGYKLDVYGSTRLGSSTYSTLTVRGTSIFNNNFYIDTSGNVATGTWHGTAIENQYGGTATNTSAWTGYAYINNGVWGTSSTGLLSGGQINNIPIWSSGATTSVVDTYSTTGTYSWTAPAGVNSVQVEARGGGGGGTGGGGGGGAYARKTITVVPGNSYTVYVGSGGIGVISDNVTNGNPGTSSWFYDISTILAKGGNGGGPSGVAGAGGSAGSSIGDVKYSGGNGGTCYTVSSPYAGGGGGGAAGDASIGGNGTNGTVVSGGTGGAGGTTGGGAGGNGSYSGNGSNGNVPGGGGGGGKYSSTGGNGATGKIVITYTINTSFSLGLSDIYQSGTNVGIGTTTPAAKLDIYNGNIDLDSTATTSYGMITKNGLTFLHDFNYGWNGVTTTIGYNTFLGVNAGNLTMGSAATNSIQASMNTAVGYQALNSNTLGYNNTAIGLNALKNNTTGYNNSALGWDALVYNTTGSGNSAFGIMALTNNNGANNNTAMGYTALTNNIDGYGNTALGSYAGRYIYDGSTGNQTSTYSTFIGYNTKPLAGNNDNQIVIGAYAIGLGSNSVVLGNDSILTTALKGKIGIGTTSPSEMLTIKATSTNAILGAYTSSSAPALYVASSGYVGIGTTNPYYQLTIAKNGTTTDTVLDILNGNGSGALNFDIDANNHSYLYLSQNSTNRIRFQTYSSSYINNSYYTTSGGLALGTTSAAGFGLYVNDSASGTAYFAGNVGIGTTTPASKLTVYGTTTLLAGNVGIGTINPTTQLHVSDGNSVSSTLISTDKFVVSAQGTAPGLSIISSGDNSAYRGVFKAVRSRGTLLSPTVPVTDDYVFSLLGAIYDGVDTEGTAVISTMVDGTVSSNVAPQRISFMTSETTGSARVERMTIKANGKIGVGTTTPLEMLTIRATSTNAIFGAYTSSSAPALYVASSGYVGIGTASPLSILHINTLTTNPLTMGSATDDTNKGAYIASTQYDTSAEPEGWLMFGGYSASSEHRMMFGGGASALNAATNLRFFTATSVTAREGIERMRINEDGNVGIGTTTPGSYRLYISGAEAYCDQTTCWNDASDIVLKDNIRALDYGLEEILQLQPSRFLFKPTNEESIGLIAQEVEKIIPEVVSGQEGSKGIAYGSLTPVIIKAIQELNQKIDNLEIAADGSVSSTEVFASSSQSQTPDGFVEELKSIVEIAIDSLSGLPKIIVQGILEVKNDIVAHGTFKSIIKVAKSTIGGRTIIFENNQALAENTQLSKESEDDESVFFATYNISSPQKEIMVSGSGKLIADIEGKAVAKIAFHPSFASVISGNSPIRVIITPTSYINGNLYVAEKSIYGFVVKEINSQDPGAEFDWIVTARLMDPQEAQEILSKTENIASQENFQQENISEPATDSSSGTGTIEIPEQPDNATQTQEIVPDVAQEHPTSTQEIIQEQDIAQEDLTQATDTQEVIENLPEIQP